MARQGQNHASGYDRDSFVYGFTGLLTGNHVATIVTFEPTGNYSVQRMPGLFTDTNIGLGFGDQSGNGVISANEILGSGGLAFSTLLYSQGASFNAAADVDGDGEITNLDLFALGPALTSAGASAAVMTAYDQLLVKRGDVNSDGFTDATDVASLYASFGSADWLHDLNADGTVSMDDVETLVAQLVRTSHADFNLDRKVDGADFLAWQRGVGASGARFDQGDASLNGEVTAADLAAWRTDFGLAWPIGGATAAGIGVPEPAVGVLALLATTCLFSTRRRDRGAHTFTLAA
jgi:hypothetical protein